MKDVKELLDSVERLCALRECEIAYRRAILLADTFKLSLKILQTDRKQ